MKNLVLAAFLIIGSSSFAQMSASDVQMAMGSISNDGIQKIYLNNKRKYFNDGSTAIAQDKYMFSRATFTYSETSLILNYYNSDSKLNQAATVVIPYASIERLEVAKTSISICLGGR